MSDLKKKQLVVSELKGATLNAAKTQGFPYYPPLYYPPLQGGAP